MILAVLEGDFMWIDVSDLADLPEILVERLVHYFSTYKLVPHADVQIEARNTCGAPHTARVVAAAIGDYQETMETTSS